MTKAKKTGILISKQAMVLTGMTVGIIYPFMGGAYDRLAMPLSALLQGIGIIGLVFPVLGILWLVVPDKSRLFATITLSFASFLTLVFAFMAYLIAGIFLGIIVLVFLAGTIGSLRQRLKNPKDNELGSLVPAYLIVIPLSILAIQLSIAKPVTDWSRGRTIANADAYIQDIERFKSRNGYYPKTLQAMYTDYYPQTVGVEKFHYLPYGDSYNISFEQPRFFLDIIGTKEWVVYNPKDEHRVYSHTSWFLLLSPEESESRQGWYASADTHYKHWKSFLFD